MSIVDKYFTFVKDHFEFHDRRAREFERNSPTRAKRHRDTADTLSSLLNDLEAIEKSNKSNGAANTTTIPPKIQRMQLTEEEIAGLPTELLQELNLSAGDRAEFAILGLLEEAAGPLTLDKLLIGLYRKTGEIHKRKDLGSRLYRMAEKNSIYIYPKKKGLYALEAPAGADSKSSENEPE